MPYARAPGRSVTAATSGRARRDSLGTSIGHEPARDGSAPYGPAALGATAPLGAGAAINRHRYVHGPPIGRLPPIDAGATVVELASVLWGGARRAPLGASRGRGRAGEGSAPSGRAALGATAPRGAGAAINRHRYVQGPPIGRLPPIDAGATVVELASVASGPAVGERFVTHGASRWRRGGGKLIRPPGAPVGGG